MTSVSSRACSNMVDDEEAVVLACTSLVFFVRTHKENRKKTSRSVGQRLSEKRETLQFLANIRFSESQSDLVKLHAHRHRAV